MQQPTITVTDTGSPDTTYVQVMPGCAYCGAYHEGTCPRVEELEYYPGGALKRVRLRQELVQIGLEIPPQPVRPETGHTYGVDCPETVWRNFP